MGIPISTDILEVPKKVTVIRLRWLLVIVCSYLLLFSQEQSFLSFRVYSFILIYLLSNALLYLLDERLFDSPYFYAPLVLFDTFNITASLMISGQIGTDFYLTYFLIIILCAVLQDFVGSIVVAVLSSGLYGYLLWSTVEGPDSSIYLRPSFLFVVSLFYGYFAQIIKSEKARKEQAEARLIIAEQLAEVDRVKFEFLANTTHELRTPLTSIMGFGELLLSDGFGPLTQAQRTAVGCLLDSAHGLFGLVEQILDLGRVQKGETGLSVRRQGFTPLIDELQRELAPLETTRPYRIQYEVEEGLPAIETDWGKLKSVLVNILTNAIKFTDQGEVKLSIKNGSSSEVSFTVSDTGIGIPKGKIPVIFDNFRQVDGSQTRQYGGTGIGLAISKNFVELIGGKIEVESEVGTGSAFKVIIPVASH